MKQTACWWSATRPCWAQSLVGEGLGEDDGITVAAAIASEDLGTLVDGFSRVVGVPPLPSRRGQGGRDGTDEAGIVVGDHRMQSQQAPDRQTAQERQPASPVFRRGDLDAQGFPIPVGVDGDGQEAGKVDYPAALADLDGNRVDLQVGVGALVQGSATEVVDQLV